MRPADEPTAQMRPSAQGLTPRPVAAYEATAGGDPPYRFPAVGDRFADCRLLAELGRGTEGRVFLASQPDLGDRLIVLKVTPAGGGEHLALARLVHTHVAPLLFARDLPAAGLRLLAMPFVGGTSLLRVRDRLRELSAPCSGRNVVDVLARSGPELPTPAGTNRPLERLARLDAPTFAAWLGTCLADALGHAHDRGLIHLDVKPGNILLAADGTPLLLDFHLAQEQIAAGASAPQSFGGTRAYMAPEQLVAGEAFRRREGSPVAVDGRSDLYALGVTLFEMLAGVRPDQPNARAHLRKAGASAGLAAILTKCVHGDPARRYSGASSLAEDLRRHLAHRPLRGVPNRSLGERWRKWRRRNPGAMGRLVVSAVVVAALAVGLLASGRSLLDKRRAFEGDIAEASRLREQGYFAAAVQHLEMKPRPTGGAEADRYDVELDAARRQEGERRARRSRAKLAGDLARLADDLRLGWDLERLDLAQKSRLTRRCALLWDRRAGLTTPSPAEREGLIEVALVLSALEKNETRLDEAEATLGKDAALDSERSRLRNRPAPPYRAVGQAIAWEDYWAGRALLKAGMTEEAGRRFAAAAEARPDAIWPSFYEGVCAARLGDHRGAERAFRVCEALLPDSAEIRVDRASALSALGRTGEARACLDRALALRPGLGQAWYQRGVLNAREGKRPEAIADLEHALAEHAPVGPTHFNLAVLFREAGRPSKAREHLRMALEAMPGDAEALRLGREIEKGRER